MSFLRAIASLLWSFIPAQTHMRAEYRFRRFGQQNSNLRQSLWVNKNIRLLTGCYFAFAGIC
jgi:hypothetical protein